MKIKPFKLERYYTLHEHTAKYSLCNSDCEAMTIADLLSLEKGAKELIDFFKEINFTEDDFRGTKTNRIINIKSKLDNKINSNLRFIGE